jgi:hypothetical protein
MSLVRLVNSSHSANSRPRRSRNWLTTSRTGSGGPGTIVRFFFPSSLLPLDHPMLIRRSLQGHRGFGHELPRPTPAKLDFANLAEGTAAVHAADDRPQGTLRAAVAHQAIMVGPHEEPMSGLVPLPIVTHGVGFPIQDVHCRPGQPLGTNEVKHRGQFI